MKRFIFFGRRDRIEHIHKTAHNITGITLLALKVETQSKKLTEGKTLFLQSSAWVGRHLYKVSTLCYKVLLGRVLLDDKGYIVITYRLELPKGEY